MPALTPRTAAARKRKRDEDTSRSLSVKRRVIDVEDESVQVNTVEELARQISTSTKYYENVATLLSMCNLVDPDATENYAVLLSLCKIFSRLAANGSLGVSQASPGQDRDTALWLRGRLEEYQEALLDMLKTGGGQAQVSQNRR